MKTKKRLAGLVFVVITVFAVFLVQTRNAEKRADRDESQIEKMARWRSEAETGLRKECTNDVVGLNRIISTAISHSSDVLRDWRGTATAEYVNKVGGVERTNLYFIFWSSFGHIVCMRDYEKDHRDYLEHLEQVKAAIR